MAYKRQFYPGETTPAKNRRRYMDPKVKLKKLRDVPLDDVV
ncbi:MAG: methyl-coenzyme M reductase subunit gamma, partial [Candidatus Methanomethylophilaceae archaeon]|nr:methyl-coenzyme M reductase subunit gamma [Candidatus Methanomethylophilaceae archaeon]